MEKFCEEHPDLICMVLLGIMKVFLEQSCTYNGLNQPMQLLKRNRHINVSMASLN